MLDIYYACEFIENPWRKVLEQNKFRQENGNTEQQTEKLKTKLVKKNREKMKI